MTVYSISTFVGGQYGLRYGRPSAASQTNCALALECEGANGTAYANTVAPFGVNDVADTTTGVLTVVDNWVLTTARANLGTSSLAWPGSGTTAYLRTPAISSQMRSGTMTAFVYLDALPAGGADFMHWTSDSTRPTAAPVRGWWLTINPAGTLSFTQRANSITTTRTTTATIPVTTWRFISAAWFFDKLWIGINGTVEAFDLVPEVSGSTSLYGVLKGGAGFGGIYGDDIRIDKRFDPRFSANYTVPTQTLESFSPEASRATIAAKTFQQDRVTTTSTPLEPRRIAGRAVAFSGTTFTRYTPTISPSLAYLLGITDNGSGLIDKGAGSGGGGSTRPSSGLVYPRGDC